MLSSGCDSLLDQNSFKSSEQLHCGPQETITDIISILYISITV